MTTPIALTIAGSDPSGGAGVQADLKTFAALGVYGVSAIAALTVQNTQSVGAIHDVPADFIAAQIDALFDDLDIAAVKIGMLSRATSIAAVADALDRHSARNIVLDPVMVATSGAYLLAPEAVSALRSMLFAPALIVTPNLQEAAALTGASLARNEREMEIQAREILALGARHVLIKGGHGEGEDSVDLLVGQGEVTRFVAKRIATKNTHGTGCTLSSAIAAGLAKGLALKDGRCPGQSLRHRRHRRRRCAACRPRPRPARPLPKAMEQFMTTRRNLLTGAGLTLAGAVAAPGIARAATLKWKMVTSWPKRLPGPGMSAERIAARIRALSGGRIDITVYAAGEVVPAFGVLDAVGNGVADIGHTAAFYWQGKMPAAAFFTTVPFGLTPSEHVAWIEAGGGQALMGRAVQAVRRQALHGRQYRRLHGRLVPPQAQRARRPARA